MSNALEPKWSVREARERVPADIVANHAGLCGVSTGTFHAGCPRCRWLMSTRARLLAATTEGRAQYRAAARRANAAGKGSHTTRNRRRKRTEAEADTDFSRCWPEGKPCPSCGEVFGASAFDRNWTNADGRERRCSRNGCRNRDRRLKQLARIAVVWASRGLPTDRCGYCLSAPIEHIDHFHPSARGGADHPDNYVGACPGCNLAKSDRLPFDWLAATHPDRVDFFRALFPEETA